MHLTACHIAELEGPERSIHLNPVINVVDGNQIARTNAALVAKQVSERPTDLYQMIHALNVSWVLILLMRFP